MKFYEPELHALLKKFESLLHEYPDDPSSYFVLKNFLKIFLRIKKTNVLLPTSEIITIIQYQKPNLFHLLKKQSTDSTYLYFLSTKEMSYDHAKRNLSNLQSQLTS